MVEVETTMSKENISIQLTKSQAVVLFEFLARSQEEGPLQIQHPAEKQVFENLCTELEAVILAPSASDYDELLREAREQVVRGGL